MIIQRLLLCGFLVSAPSGPGANSEPGSHGGNGLLLPRFARVSDRLFRGSQPDARALEQLKALGVNTVVSLRKDASERGQVESLGMRFVHMPVTLHPLGLSDAAGRRRRAVLRSGRQSGERRRLRPLPPGRRSDGRLRRALSHRTPTPDGEASLRREADHRHALVALPCEEGASDLHARVTCGDSCGGGPRAPQVARLNPGLFMNGDVVTAHSLRKPRFRRPEKRRFGSASGERAVGAHPHALSQAYATFFLSVTACSTGSSGASGPQRPGDS
jgi:hypothetical protein